MLSVCLSVGLLPVRQEICVSNCLPVCRSVCIFFVCGCVYIPVCLYAFPFVGVRVSVRMSVCLPAGMYACKSVGPGAMVDIVNSKGSKKFDLVIS